MMEEKLFYLVFEQLNLNAHIGLEILTHLISIDQYSTKKDVDTLVSLNRHINECQTLFNNTLKERSKTNNKDEKGKEECD